MKLHIIDGIGSHLICITNEEISFCIRQTIRLHVNNIILYISSTWNTMAFPSFLFTVMVVALDFVSSGSGQELGLGKAAITGLEYAGTGCPEGSVSVAGSANSTGYVRTTQWKHARSPPSDIASFSAFLLNSPPSTQRSGPVPTPQSPALTAHLLSEFNILLDCSSLLQASTPADSSSLRRVSRVSLAQHIISVKVSCLEQKQRD